MNGKPIAFLYTKGKLLPGEKAEQWRGEGHCEAIPIEDVYHLIPHFTITSIVGSVRVALENANMEKAAKDNGHRPAMISKSHFTEIMQKTRMELEKNEISMDELDRCIRAFRLQPDRVECMLGGPDSVMWERWEWKRDAAGDCPVGSISWSDARLIVPH